MQEVIFRECKNCGKKFQIKTTNQRFCSDSCYQEVARERWREEYRKRVRRRLENVEERERHKISIAEKCKEAKEKNISYGELQKQRYLAEHETIKDRIEREKKESEKTKSSMEKESAPD